MATLETGTLFFSINRIVRVPTGTSLIPPAGVTWILKDILVVPDKGYVPPDGSKTWAERSELFPGDIYVSIQRATHWAERSELFPGDIYVSIQRATHYKASALALMDAFWGIHNKETSKGMKAVQTALDAVVARVRREAEGVDPKKMSDELRLMIETSNAAHAMWSEYRSALAPPFDLLTVQEFCELQVEYRETDLQGVGALIPRELEVQLNVLEVVPLL